jgi:hypothetical protein
MEWHLEFCWPWLSFVRKYASWWTVLTKHVHRGLRCVLKA